MLQTIYKKQPGIVKRKIADEVILVPVGNMGNADNSIETQQKIFSLNGVGEYVYDCIDGVKTIEQILADVFDNFEVSLEQAQTDVVDFIESLAEHNIISK